VVKFQSSEVGLHVGWCIHASVSEEITAPIFSTAQTFPVKASNHLPEEGICHSETEMASSPRRCRPSRDQSGQSHTSYYLVLWCIDGRGTGKKQSKTCHL